MEMAASGAGLTPMSDETRGYAIKRRREALGIFGFREFKRAAGRVGITVDRDLIGPAERGEEGISDNYYGKLEQALDRLEEEMGADQPANDGEKTVKYRISGNFGVDVVVEAPISEMAEAEASAVRLLRQMQSQEDQ